MTPALLTVWALSAVALLPAQPSRAPALAILRAEAERILGDWRDGRVERSYGRFAAALRQHATAQEFAASMESTKQRFGAFVRIEDAQLGQGSRIGDQAVAVVESTVRFEHGAVPVVFTFVEEVGAWRLRGLAVQDPANPMPALDERLVPGAARVILDGAVRGGLGTVAARFPPEGRDVPEEAMRAKLEGQHRLLGALRSYEQQGEPSLNMIRCRDMTARGLFEHGRAALSLTFCPLAGEWRVFEIEVTPEMTAPLFERLATLAIADGLKRTDLTLRCPPVLVPVGGTATCRLTLAGQHHDVEVQRVKEGALEVTGLP